MLGRKPTVLALASIAAMAALLRYPYTLHEMGTDSFVIHSLTQLVLDRQQAPWILNPLSLFGLYPLSYPSAPIFELGGLASISGLPAEGALLFLDGVTGIVGSLGVFLMTREIDRDPRLGLIAAFLFSLSPHFVSSTTWQVPTRTQFTALIPFFVWSMLVLRRQPTLRNGIVFVVIIFLLLGSHRLAVLMSVVVVAYVVAALVIAGLRLIRTTSSGIMLRRSTATTLRVGAWLAVLAVALYFILFSGMLGNYETGRLVSGENPVTQLQNLGVSMIRANGLTLPLAFLGIVGVMRSRNKDIRQFWLVLILLGLLPTLALRQYIGAYTPPFAALFVGLGLLWILRSFRKAPKLRKIAVAGVVVVALVSSTALIQYDLNLLVDMKPDVYDAGLYLRYGSNGTYVSNSGFLGAQLSAVSGGAYMPIGGATTADQGPEILAFGFMSPTALHVSVIPLSALTVEDDSVFYLQGVSLEHVWAVLLSGSITEKAATNTMRTYAIKIYVEDPSLRHQFTAFGDTYYSAFGTSVDNSRYLTYYSPSIRMYQLP